MTQGAMGNLINRYRAVLRKCRVKNAMNRIVLAGALLAAPLFAEGLSSVTGGTGTVWAATYSLDNQANDFAHTGAPQSGDAKSSGLTGTVGTEHAGDSIYGGLATTPSSQSYDSIASGNNLTIEGDGSTSFSKIAIAGYASNGGSGSSTASNNVLTVTNALFDNNGAYITQTGIVGGMADFQSGDVLGKDAIADNNTVTVQGEGSKVRIRVLGAQASHNDYSQTVGIARANGNSVDIRDGAWVIGAVLGAEAIGDRELEEGYAEANGNTVKISNATIGEADGSGALYPVTGASVNAMRVQNSYGNTVEISGSVLTGGHAKEDSKSYVLALSIIAGADPVSTRDNIVRFSDSEIDGYVSGTYLKNHGGSAEASGTKVTVQGSKVGGDVKGDYVSSAAGDAIAERGSVSVLNNSTVGGIVTGASTTVGGTISAASRASGNTLTIENSKVGSYVYGGLAMNGTGGIAEASGNTLNLKNVNAPSLIMPSFAQNNGSGKAVAEGNTVTLQGGTYGGSIFVSYAYAAGNTASAGGNTVTLQGGTYSGVIYGSYAYAARSTATAGGNTITLRGGTHDGSILGSYAHAAGNTSAAQSNAVTESATAGDATIRRNTAIAEGNTVTLHDGTYSGSIFGSRAYAAGSAAAAGGNTVTLQGDDVYGDGSPSFSAQVTVIWGSYALGGNKVYAPSSPNTLNFIDAKGMTAANICNFSILKYTLPNMISQESVLTLTGGADSGQTDISNASVSVAVSEVWGRDGGEFGFGGDKSPENDRIILLKNDNGLVSDGWKQEGTIIAREGVSLAFELAAATDDTSLYLYRPETFIDPSDPDHPHPNDTMVNPQTKALAEGWLAGLTLGIQAGNVAADQGIGAMRYAAVRLDREGWLPFGVLEGGSMKYDSGSHINLQSLSLLAGLGRGVSTDWGLLIVGGFFEYGTGSYKTHNSFDTMPSVDGSGNAWYMGGGLLASIDFKKTGDGHFYLEGSAHTGMLHNSFDGDALRDAYGRTAEFDTDTPYYNLHAGLGYLWNFAEDHSLDIYGKYYWTRVLGTDETLNTGDHVDFDDITSSRTRLGARYAYQATEHVSTYIGAAWEHEFEGVSDSSVFGYDIDSPKIRGDSGRGEMGLRFTPTDDLPLTVDIGVQGYAGKKEGVTGSLFVQYEF